MEGLELSWAVRCCAGLVTKQGSFAEYTTVDERIVGRKPKSVGHEDAAALPLVV
jgi:NADPH2:quinone reductase